MMLVWVDRSYDRYGKYLFCAYSRGFEKSEVERSINWIVEFAGLGEISIVSKNILKNVGGCKIGLFNFIKSKIIFLL